ncbi:MAG: cysteine-rich CWC family protein [Pyrinomonadaceae bacterium]|nr:cysteine-rich CWC family protein [Pyrinomonadaceae bacterium]
MRKALGIVSNKYKDPQICESCGAEFGCGVSLTGCWCMKVKLTDEQRADLKSKYKKCLCPECLEKVAADNRI